jgi:hypothetical protein
MAWPQGALPLLQPGIRPPGGDRSREKPEAGLDAARDVSKPQLKEFEMLELSQTCFLFLVALAGGFIGVVLANTSLAVFVWVCTSTEEQARRQRD